MKNITKETIEKHLRENTTALFPTQQALCVPIINRIYKKMLNGLKFDDIKISKDLVIDGHHRYVSALLAEKKIGNVPTNQTSATKQYDWKDVDFVDVEWDTKDKIDKLNKEDAEFNNMPLTKIIKMVE